MCNDDSLFKEYAMMTEYHIFNLVIAIAFYWLSTNVCAANISNMQFELRAIINSTCYISTSQSIALDFSSQFNTTTALLNRTPITRTISAYCNNAMTTMALKSHHGGLKLNTVPNVQSGIFAGYNSVNNTVILPYIISGSWANINFDNNFDSDAQAVNTDDKLLTTAAINGIISLKVELDEQVNKPVLAGYYADMISITLTTSP